MAFGKGLETPTVAETDPEIQMVVQMGLETPMVVPMDP